MFVVAPKQFRVHNQSKKKRRRLRRLGCAILGELAVKEGIRPKFVLTSRTKVRNRKL